jgi:hypothetical protein
MPHPDPSPSPPRRPWVAPLAFGVAAALLAAGARAADPPDRSVDAPHGMRVTVKMIGPTAQATDLQVLCILEHDPAGDTYVEAMRDLDDRLGGLLSGLRDRGEFTGEAGETLLFTPPPGSIPAKRVLLIGVGKGATLTLDRLRLAGTIAAREALRIGAEHVSFAPALRDQGSSRIDVADGDRAVVEQVVLAYDTDKRMQAQRLAPAADLREFTIEAGPKFFDATAVAVRAGVAIATAQVQARGDAPYVGRAK